MTFRVANSADLPTLERWAEKSGFPYPTLSKNIETAIMVEDDAGKPLCAIAAERIVQLYFWKGELDGVLALNCVLKELHPFLAAVLRQKGYEEANAFLPPRLFGSFSRMLKKRFGWVDNWPSLARRF